MVIIGICRIYIFHFIRYPCDSNRISAGIQKILPVGDIDMQPALCGHTPLMTAVIPTRWSHPENRYAPGMNAPQNNGQPFPVIGQTYPDQPQRRCPIPMIAVIPQPPPHNTPNPPHGPITQHHNQLRLPQCFFGPGLPCGPFINPPRVALYLPQVPRTSRRGILISPAAPRAKPYIIKLNTYPSQRWGASVQKTFCRCPNNANLVIRRKINFVRHFPLTLIKNPH